MATVLKQVFGYAVFFGAGGCAIGALLGALGVIPHAKSLFSLTHWMIGFALGVVVGIWKSLEGQTALVAESAPRAVLRIVLVMMTIIYALAGIAAGVFSLLAGMMFDEPGSTQRPELLLAFWRLRSFPSPASSRSSGHGALTTRNSFRGRISVCAYHWPVSLGSASVY